MKIELRNIRFFAVYNLMCKIARLDLISKDWDSSGIRNAIRKGKLCDT